jgi:hypothetical protein
VPDDAAESADCQSQEEFMSQHCYAILCMLGLMPAGYYQPITQWSKGEYTDANNVSNTPKNNMPVPCRAVLQWACSLHA